MKIYDWQKLSGTIASGLTLLWWVMLGLMIAGVPLETYLLFFDPPEGSFLAQVTRYVELTSSADRSLFYKLLMIGQTIVIVPVVLILIKRLGYLFRNFSREKIFIRENIRYLEQITLLVLLLSVVSVNLLSLLICLVTWILVALFRHGTDLQDESDWTV